MQVTFRVELTDNAGSAAASLRITSDLPFSPSTDTEFTHPPLESPRKPTVVTFDIESKTFDVFLGFVKCKSLDDAREIAKMHYLPEGWQLG